MTETEKQLPNVVVLDTNVLIDDPNSIDKLREGGNKLVIPLKVILELDALKEKAIVQYEARQAIARIEEIRYKKDPSLVIERETRWGNYDLDRNIPDHKILATFLKIVEDFHRKTKNRKYDGYGKVKLVSRDKTMRILARDMNLGDDVIIEDYRDDRIEVAKTRKILEVKISGKKLNGFDSFQATDAENYEEIKEVQENEGAICLLQTAGPKSSWERSFCATYKQGKFTIIKEDIRAAGITPKNNGERNWMQSIALAQLLDPNITAVFLKGGTGTGKTLLAIAAGVEQQNSRVYKQIIITRPMIHLEDEDRMGFLPGGVQEKMGPWIIPIQQALDLIEEKGKARVKDLMEKNKIIIEPLDYFRGQTICNAWFIVDEAQNLTLHQVRTLITRVGVGTKIIFTGDLDQIDRKNIDKKSSGLASAVNRLSGHELVGVTNFEQTVRSPLAALAREVL